MILYQLKGHQIGWLNLSIPLTLALIVLLQQSQAQNLIQNPNFTNYLYNMTNYIGQEYVLVQSDPNLWYNQDGSQIEIKNKTMPFMGDAAELVGTTPYYLCQRVNLETGAQYQIGFLGGNNQGVPLSNITAYLNGTPVFSLVISGSLTILYGLGRFISQTGNGSALCFHCTFTPNPNHITYGPTINNLSLIKVVNATTTNTTTSNTLGNSYKTAVFFIKSIVFKYFRYLTMFIDDIQYYKYHRYQYPKLCQQLMSKFDILNQLTPKLWQELVRPFSKFISLQPLAHQNSLYMINYTPHPNNPQSIYFLNSIQSIYLIDLPLAILSYVVPKLLFFVVRAVKNRTGARGKSGVSNEVAQRSQGAEKGKGLVGATRSFNRSTTRAGDGCLGTLYRFLGRNFRWWSFVILAIQNNVSKLVFYSGMQMVNLQQLYFTNKVNITICISLLLIVIIYCIIFYPLVCLYEKQKLAQTILIHSSYYHKGYHLQSYCFLTRLLLRALIHSIFLQNYQYQIAGLACADLLVLSLMVVMRDRFYNKLYFFTYFGYNLSLLVIDALFFVHKRDSSIFSDINFQLMMFIVLWVVIFAYIFSILVCTSKNIYQIYIFVKKKAQVNKFKKQQPIKYQVHKKKHNTKQKSKIKTQKQYQKYQKQKKLKKRIKRQKTNQQIMIYVQKQTKISKIFEEQNGKEKGLDFAKGKTGLKISHKNHRLKKSNNYLI